MKVVQWLERLFVKSLWVFFLLLTRLLPSSLKGTHWWNVGQLCTAYVHWVRLFSFPGSTPVCGLLFFTGRTCADNYPRSSWKKNPTHTGVDPGKLNERTHCKLCSNWVQTTSILSDPPPAHVYFPYDGGQNRQTEFPATPGSTSLLNTFCIKSQDECEVPQNAGNTIEHRDTNCIDVIYTCPHL